MPQDEDLLTESFSARRKCFTVFQRITVVSNIIFALFALLLIVLGGVAVKRLGEYSTYVRITIPAGLIVLGVILLFIIMLGVFGSFKKSTKLLAAYFVLLFVFIICEFGVGGGSYTLRNQIPSKLHDTWGTLNDQDKVQQQQYWNCCGWANPDDHPGTNCAQPVNTTTTTSTSTSTTAFITGSTGAGLTGTGSSGTGSSTPSSRRSYSEYRQTPTPTPASNNVTVFSNVGCEQQVVDFFQSELYAVGTAGIVFATLQLVALISSIVVFAFIKVEQRRSQDERF